VKNNRTFTESGTLARLCSCILFVCSAVLADAAPPTRIACVGSSSTYGYGLTNRLHDSYPAWLQRWLGTNYDVRNFGVNGATLMSKGDKPYILQEAYTNALAFRPDVVVINLGGNDSKHPLPGDTNNVPNNWQHNADFVPDYEALIASFRQANPAARIYVCDPAPAFPGRWGINDDTIHHEILPRIHRVAVDSKATEIDLYAAFDGRKELFPDTVHPNETGARLLAGYVYAVVMHEAPPFGRE
jgi:lysophospholipase L1-like esterase